MKKILLLAGAVLIPFGMLAFQSPEGNINNQYARDDNFITSPNLLWYIGILSLLAFIIGVASFIMVFRQIKRVELAKSADKDIPKAFFPSNDDLHLRRKWEAEHEKLELIVADLKAKLFDFESRFKALEDDSRVVELKVEKSDRASVSQDSPALEMLYAKFPDTYEGFSAATLSSQQDGEKIYEIAITGETATYKISEDKDAQSYALSDYTYYLGNACTMENAPEKDCRIFTEVPGKLFRKGKDWTIETKARIKFI